MLPMSTRETLRARAAVDPERDDWWRITKNTADAATVHIYDEIGYWGLTAADLKAQLSELDVSNIEVRLSSPGGEVHDGFTILEALRSHRARVTVYIDGLAASIASVIAMGGDEIIMGRHAEMMIHEASGLCLGNAAEMQKMIEDLNRESDRIAGVYQERAGGRRDVWRSRMKAETWYSADEAVEVGLADKVAAKQLRQVALAAHFDPEACGQFRYKNRAEAPAPDLTVDEPEPEVRDTEGADEPPVEAVETAAAPIEPEAEPTPEPEPEPLTEAEAEQPAEAATEAKEPEPDLDPWAAAVAHLTTVPDPDAEFARLTEALK